MKLDALSFRVVVVVVVGVAVLGVVAVDVLAGSCIRPAAVPALAPTLVRH
jgi:hypothetical protein